VSKPRGSKLYSVVDYLVNVEALDLGNAKIVGKHCGRDGDNNRLAKKIEQLKADNKKPKADTDR
jgi:hypothetical protein